MTLVPGSTLPATNGCSAAAEASCRTDIRHRPMPRGSLTSTAMPTSDFLPLARPPASPAPPPPRRTPPPPPPPPPLAPDDLPAPLYPAGQQVPARPPQHRPQPVQHRPRRLVRADLQRPLQALRRDAVLLRREDPACGEPHRQRRPRPVEGRARCPRRAPAAAAALESAITQPPPARAACRAGETALPAQPLQVIQAVRVRPEPRLELARRPRVVHAATRLIHALRLLRLNGYPGVALRTSSR